MSRRIPKFILAATRNLLALYLSLAAYQVSASTLTIDSSQSHLDFQIDMINTDDFTVIGPLVAQGDVPQGSLPFGNGMRTPGYSTGLSAQPTGTIDITTNAFSITNATSIHLLNSGSWQPGTPGGGTFGAAPIPGELGAYLEGTLIGPDPDLFIIGRVYGALFNMATSTLALGPNGTFDDSNAVATLADGRIDLSAINPLTGLYNSSNLISVNGPKSGVFDLSGTYEHGQLSLWLDGSVVVSLSYLFQGLPVGLNMSVTGHILTSQVPEPTSSTLLIAGVATAIGIPALRFRRRRYWGRHRTREGWRTS
jgi:hypothetical protein